MKIDKTKPVMVTGASGYIAGSLIKKLLSEGIIVHAALRNPESEIKTDALKKLATELNGTLKIFKSDLLIKGTFKEAMDGCEVVFHTASPFFMKVDDPLTDLVIPAVDGTKNVLDSVNLCPSVKRVVLTSSVAAVYSDNIDLEEIDRDAFNEEVWNTKSSLTHNPYSYSKTMAEREAWSMCEKQDHWDLVTINPSLVVGPGIKPFTNSESFNILKQFGDGTLFPAVPKLALGIVDVRDVAEAHFQAAYTSEAKGRYIVSGYNSAFFEIAKILQENFGKDYPIPKFLLPKWVVWAIGPILNKSLTREYVKLNIGVSCKLNNSKSTIELGISYRPLKESIIEFFEQVISTGAFKK